ncbi:thioesterase II family protein [Streptomyces graminilatus]|uniref:thioesterase II family protein n=1 Tax=Streptomyces graminilatus TaxID=1464070 RepID=UPI0006E28F3B|nr:alpha/beta fold hydrolase [Streptomyces graminilatus]
MTAQTRSAPVLVGLRDGSPTAPLIVLLPHSGCNSTVFLPVAHAMTGGSPVVGVDYPGHGARFTEALAPDVLSIATETADAVLALAPPEVVLFGHSFGSIVGFEVARALTARGVRVRRLIASSCVDPHAMAAQTRTVHLETDEVLLDLLVGHGGIEQELLDEPELLEVMLPVIRHDTRLGEIHRPQPGAVIGAPVTAVGGSDDPTVSEEDLAGWGGCTTAGCTVAFVPGGHFHVMEHPHNIASLLTDAADSAASPPRTTTEGKTA